MNNGDVKSQKLILDRALPPLKAVSPPLPKDLPTGDIVEMLQGLISSISRGETSPSVGLEVMTLIKQAAELQANATAEVRAKSSEKAAVQAEITRLEIDIASASSLVLKKFYQAELNRQRKRLEAMYNVLACPPE